MLPPNELGTGKLDPQQEAEIVGWGAVYAYTTPGLRPRDPHVLVSFRRPPAYVAADIVRFVREQGTGLSMAHPRPCTVDLVAGGPRSLGVMPTT